MTAKWKELIASLLIFQIIFSVPMYNFDNTALYLARLNCNADWCESRALGYVLTNQGAWDTHVVFLELTAILVILTA